MRLNVLSIQGVVESRLCTGCGACAAAAPGAVRMVDTLGEGRRPVVRAGADESAMSGALRACPGVGLTHEKKQGAWGAVLEVWEGHAADDEVRFRASSGGIATALAVFCLEHAGMHGVVHTAARADVPYLNTTTMSRTRGEVLAAAGSRYAPASPCDGLGMIEYAPGECVFIGKPCDVAGAYKLAGERAALKKNLGLTVAFFCAGTPTTEGTLEMLRAMGIDDAGGVSSVRYRGHGWPGRARAERRGGGSRSMSYEDAWGKILTKHKQWRCNVCADHTGEFADIAVGDAWHREQGSGDPGRSIVIARTERGRRVLHAAMAAGVVELERSDIASLRASQPSLLRTRGAVWGRVLALRALRLPAPRYRGMSLLATWRRELTPGMKVRSVVGTWRRVARKGLARRCEVRPAWGGRIEEVKAARAEPRATAARGARRTPEGAAR